jgi:hypothetical protein
LFDCYRLDPTGTTWSKVIAAGACQWYVNSRIVVITYAPFASEEVILHFLRVPLGTDIQEGDIVNVQPGDDFWYQLVETERVHLNFPNEYGVGFATNVDAVSLPFGVIYTEDGIQIQTELPLLPLFTETP